MDLQRTWRKRQQYRVHHWTSARRRTLLVHGRVRAQDPLREPAYKTRVLTSSRKQTNASSSILFQSPDSSEYFTEPKLSTTRPDRKAGLVKHGLEGWSPRINFRQHRPGSRPGKGRRLRHIPSVHAKPSRLEVHRPRP